MSCDPCLQGTTPVSAQLHDSIGDCRQYTVHVFVLCSGAEKKHVLQLRTTNLRERDLTCVVSLSSMRRCRCGGTRLLHEGHR